MLPMLNRIMLFSVFVGFSSIASAGTAPIGASLTTALAATLYSNQAHETVYQLTNNLPFAVPVTYTPLSKGGIFVVDNGIPNACPAVLQPGQSCQCGGQFTAGSAAGTAEATLRLTYPGNVVKLRQSVVLSGTSAGHFMFRDSGGNPLNQLDLAPNATGNVTLHNTGGSAITGFNVAFSNGTGTYFTGTCRSETTIAAGGSCTLHYTIPGSAAATPFTVKATGNGADNSPLVLNGDIATQGHFVFRDSGGNDITHLDLAPNAMGNLTLHNTGSRAITGYSLLFDNMTIGGYFSGTCRTETTIAAQSSCTLAYTIPPVPTAPGDFTMTASGTGADNSPLTLNGHVALIHAFITSFAGVMQCTVNPVSGAFSACGNTGATGLIGSVGIVLNASGTRAFIASPGNGKVIQCTVDPVSGDFSDCGDTGFPLTITEGIVLNASGTRVFVTAGDKVFQCTVDPLSGAFSDCGDTGVTGLSGPRGIVLNAAGTRAFIVSSINSQVVECTVDPASGAFDPCANTGATGLGAPKGIVLNAAGTRAFIAGESVNSNGQVIECTVNPATGAFSDCDDTGATGLVFPKGIVLNAAGTRAFIASASNHQVVECTVNPANGTFSNCANTGAIVVGPQYITIYPTF